MLILHQNPGLLKKPYYRQSTKTVEVQREMINTEWGFDKSKLFRKLKRISCENFALLFIFLK